MPLAWAHAEYIKLVRSMALGHAIDLPEAAWRRYQGRRPAAKRATWRFSGPRPAMGAGQLLRLELLARCRVHYTFDDWSTGFDVDALDSGLGVWVADVPGSDRLVDGQAVQATFYWPDADRWEGRNISISVVAAEG